MNKWEILGIIAAIFDPIPTGIVAGYVLYTEKKFRKTGKILMLFSVLWFATITAVMYYLSQ